MSEEKLPQKLILKDFKALQTWQKAMRLSDDIYHIVSSFPKSELYGLTSQITRATNSISANIAEGNAYTDIFPRKEINFLYISLGSCNEVISWLEIAYRQQYINKLVYERLNDDISEIIRYLIGYLNKVRKSIA